MNSEEIYIAANYEPFRVRQAYRPQIGIFYLCRLVWSIQGEGGSLLQRSLFMLLFTFTLITAAFVLDILSLICLAAFKLVKWLFKVVGAMLVDLIKIVMQNYLGTFLKLAALLSIILIIITKWQDLKEITEKILLIIF